MKISNQQNAISEIFTLLNNVCVCKQGEFVIRVLEVSMLLASAIFNRLENHDNFYHKLISL